MLEIETEKIRQNLIARTIAGKDAITYKELRRAGLPAGVTAFLRAELREWIHNDLRDTQALKNVNPQATEIPKLTRSFVNALMEEYVYPLQEFLVSLDNAIHFLGNYLCRPRWTLEHFLFEKSPIIPVATLVERLEYTHDYRYFRTLIEQVVRRKGWADIRQEDFARMIGMIDDEVVKKQSPRDLAYALKPLADFLAFAEPKAGNTLPVKPILVFFDDKKMTMVKEYVGKIVRIRGVEELTLNELAAIIEDLSLSAEQPGLLTSEDAPSAEEGAETPHEESIEPPSHEDPEDTQPPDTFHETSEPIRPVMPEPAVPQPKPARESQNVALSLTYAGLGEERHHAPLPDLNSLISEAQRERYIKQIFQRDAAYYAGIITRLNHTSTWKEASVYLNHLFQINSVDPFALDVVEFTDVVQSRYTTDTATTE